MDKEIIELSSDDILIETICHCPQKYVCTTR